MMRNYFYALPIHDKIELKKLHGAILVRI